MTTKKPTKKSKASLDTILATVERGFAAVAEDISGVKDEITDIKSTMATKDELAAVETRLDRKMDEGFTAINRRLDRIIQMQLDKHAGRIKKLETAVFAK